MVLTDELFEKGKREIPVRGCLPIDENYVLIKKSMPCTDAELDGYIENIKKAHEAGINTPRILDYRLKAHHQRLIKMMEQYHTQLVFFLKKELKELQYLQYHAI